MLTLKKKASTWTAWALCSKRLGPSTPPPKLSTEDLTVLKKELNAAKAIAQQHARELDRQKRLISSNRSPKLETAIEQANEKYPEHKLINETYAFEVLNLSVTLDYLLWSIAKSEARGSCPLDLALSVDKKWDQAELMLEAYSDYIGSPEAS